MGIIKYQYAYEDNGNYIHINNVTPDNRRKTTYRCVSCGNKLVACLGETYKHHFRHKTEVLCNTETYLHKMGKLIFAEVYEKCLQNNIPFYISFERKFICDKQKSCGFKLDNKESDLCIENQVDTIDLTQYYQTISVEKKSDSFIPDVILRNCSGYKPIYIEIKVTHPCSIEKIKSGNPIIEIAIQSEDDFDLIKNCHFQDKSFFKEKQFINDSVLKQEKVKFYNFHYPTKWKQLNLRKIDRFVIKKEGMAVSLPKTPVTCDKVDDLIEQHKQDHSLLYEIFFYETHWTKERYMFGVAKAFNNGIMLKDCFLCKYHNLIGSRFSPMKGKPIICSLSGSQCDSSNANSCSSYIPDKKAFESYLSFYNKYKEIVYCI